MNTPPTLTFDAAQVYYARLRSTGQAVAVKVQRPGALSTISKDLYVMRRGVGAYEQLVKRFTAQTTDYQQLLSTFAEGLYTEMDFRNEVGIGAACWPCLAVLFMSKHVGVFLLLNSTWPPLYTCLDCSDVVHMCAIGHGWVAALCCNTGIELGTEWVAALGSRYLTTTPELQQSWLAQYVKTR